MIERVKLLLSISDNDKDDLLNELLYQAEDIFLLLRYGSYDKVPEEYDITGYETWLVRATVELYNRMGVEGETSSNVNGVSHVFDASELSRGLRQQIVPIGTVN